MHIRDRCRICAELGYIDKRTCEVSLFESESKAPSSISEKTRPKSNQSSFANRRANDRRRHVNLLERLTDTCFTKATFSLCLVGCIAVKKLQFRFLD